MVQNMSIAIENTILTVKREIWEAFAKSQWEFVAKNPMLRVSVDIKLKKFSNQYQIKKFQRIILIN